jgi:hypothetical protein
MSSLRDRLDRRALLDEKLTELELLAKSLCPEARVEAGSLQYEDEDGHVDLFLPQTPAESEHERIDLAVAARAAAIFEETGLYILCAAFEQAADAGAGGSAS